MKVEDSESALARAVRRLASTRTDEQAWRELHAQLWPHLFATSYRILKGSRTLADDATQEALIRLFRHSRFDNFKEKPTAFVSYALAVCRNVSLTYLSRLLQEPESLEKQASPEFSPRASPDDNPELAMVRLDLLAKFTLELDEKNQQLLTLMLEGYSVEEISKKLSISLSACSMRRHRLRNDLAMLLKGWKI